MILDYSEKGKVKIDMTKYVKGMLEDFPEQISKVSPTPATDKLFNINESPYLDETKAETFHTFTAKSLFVCK